MMFLNAEEEDKVAADNDVAFLLTCYFLMWRRKREKEADDNDVCFYLT